MRAALWPYTEAGKFPKAAGVVNTVLELLHADRLPLDRIGAAYASRILTFDFCKYESAARNILEETLRPWCERVESERVP